MQKRVIVSLLAELTGAALETPSLPGRQASWTDRLFDAALDDLRNDIVPAIENQRASTKAKDLARLLKF